MHKGITCAKAVEMIPDGATLMIGGFMGVGSPHRMIDELIRQGKKHLTVIANDTGRPNIGIARLISARSISKLIATHIGLNPSAQKQLIAGEIEAELCPQGTLAERIRCGGYGLGGALTPTGIGTTVADDKRVIVVNGREFLLETPLRAEYALIAAHRCDYRGNLEYCLTARNFNQVMAMAADTVIAEPDQLVPVGVMPPDVVATPFVLVDYIVERGSHNG
jgi:acetate CoA/acetoacetate CoA-transferase alpha subunit